MQHLKVSGAVRPLKWSLGVKWLITSIEQISHLVKIPSDYVDFLCIPQEMLLRTNTKDSHDGTGQQYAGFYLIPILKSDKRIVRALSLSN